MADDWLDGDCVPTPLVPSDPAREDAAVVKLDDPAFCAPPLLLMVTPDPTWVLEDVVPDVLIVPVAVVLPLVDVDPLVDVEPLLVVPVDEREVPSVGVTADVVDDCPVDVELPELADDVPEDGLAGSALATPGEVTTRTPIPRAAANPPTRPM